MLRSFWVTVTIAIGLAAAGLAQSRNQGLGRSADAWCADAGRENRASHCEVREVTIGGANPLDIDAGRTGGISVGGWDRGDVLIRTRIVGSADSDAEAQRVVANVCVETAGGQIRADGPGMTDAHWRELRRLGPAQPPVHAEDIQRPHYHRRLPENRAVPLSEQGRFTQERRRPHTRRKNQRRTQHRSQRQSLGPCGT